MMGVSLIAERYSKSLFDLAVERNEIVGISSDMTVLDQLCRENRDLLLMLRSPVISPEKKEKVLNSMFGNRFSATSIHFLSILVRKRRESLVPLIVQDFIRLYKEFSNILTVHMTTAAPVNEGIIKRVKEFMNKYTDKQIELIVKTDPSIVGGYILNWNDRRYDASISFQIEKMKRGSARINLYVKGY